MNSESVMTLDRGVCLSWGSLMLPPQTSAQFAGDLLVALLANRFQIALVEFRLLVHLLIAHGAGKVVNAPGLVQSSEDWKDKVGV